MDRYVINGGHRLYGEVCVSGAKNAVVAILPATVLIKGRCVIENVPDIRDVKFLTNILSHMGASIERLDASTLSVDCTDVNVYDISDFEGIGDMRASYYLIGALLGRFNRARVGMPGGCDFGQRPIDQHIKGFERLGATVSVCDDVVSAEAKCLRGASIYMDKISVGATINVMLAAVRAEGQTVIENAAKEPHVVDVANFLNSMGADIRGAGTDVIKIKGVCDLTGGSYAIIPDQIEAGTYMVAAAAAGGRITVRNVIPKHLDSISAKLREAGVEIEEDDECVTVTRLGPLRSVNVKTLPYPGFPTDMQPQITTLLSVADGDSVVTESIFDFRFRYVEELRVMGAQLSVDGNVCRICGVGGLTGARIRSYDLRAGAAMLIAGLMADGRTEVEDRAYISRGYENIVDKLRSLGADITMQTVDGVY